MSAADDSLKVSFDWLNNNKDLQLSLGEEHALTGSSHHLCLFDRLHERNVKKEEGILRRVTNVQELNGLLNTQREEQSHIIYNKDSSFLNQMQPVNHIFLFRSNMDLRQKRINEKTLCMLEQASMHKISFDRFGRAQIDKTEKISQRKKNESTTGQKEVQMPSMSSNENGKDTLQDIESTSEKDNNADHHTSSESSNNFELNTKDIKMEHDKNDENSEMKSNKNDVTSISAKPPGNSYWIEALDLKYRDRCIIEDGHWVCDKVYKCCIDIVEICLYYCQWS